MSQLIVVAIIVAITSSNVFNAIRINTNSTINKNNNNNSRSSNNSNNQSIQGCSFHDDTTNTFSNCSLEHQVFDGCLIVVYDKTKNLKV